MLLIDSPWYIYQVTLNFYEAILWIRLALNKVKFKEFKFNCWCPEFHDTQIIVLGQIED